jgi:NADP-dependent 3-hydroxy acid dehydrogenase YdfG
MAEPSDNFLMIIYNALCLIVEIFYTIGKFWYLVFESYYKTFATQERSVKGDVVLVTGAGHGIGRQIAVQYSELGAIVVCWDMNEQLNLDTVKLIKSKGKKAYGYTVDVTNREKVLEAGNKVLKDVGAVTILVNNAGIMPQHDLLKHTENEIRTIFEVNVFAHFWMFEAFLPKMIASNKGHIVALSSMAGIMGLRNLVPYCGSKFAVRGIQEALSEELRASTKGESQIKFTTIYPYMVDTGLCKSMKIRFEKLMPAVEPESAAASIISAQRKGIEELSIPRHLIHLNRVLRVFPNNAGKVIADLLEAYVPSDR